MTRNFIIAAGVAAALVLPGAAFAQSNQNRQVDSATKKFITGAIQGDLAEIDVGKLAQEKGTDPSVKEFGQMLVKDHGAHKEKAEQLAKQMGVEPPSGLSVTQKTTYLKLKVLSGATFDRSFANSMVKDHQADIKKYQKQSGKKDQTGAFAKETLPTLQEHLKKAQEVAQKVKNEKTSAR
jgi:putative membrane protein